MIPQAELDELNRFLDETEGDDVSAAIRHANEARERQTLQRAVRAEEALKPPCPEPQSALLARLIRQIDDLEFSIARAVNWLDHGHSAQARAELMQWIGQRRAQ